MLSHMHFIFTLVCCVYGLVIFWLGTKFLNSNTLMFRLLLSSLLAWDWLSLNICSLSALMRLFNKVTASWPLSTPTRLKYQIKFQNTTECSSIKLESIKHSLLSGLLWLIMFSSSLRATKGLRYWTVISLEFILLFIWKILDQWI